MEADEPVETPTAFPPPQYLYGKVIEWDRALSLTPPWHWAILHMGKRLENRTKWTACNYRGPIWLHAAKGIGTREEFHETVSSIRRILDVANRSEGARLFDRMVAAGQVLKRENVGGFQEWVPGASLVRGAIVGRAWISAVLGLPGRSGEDGRGNFVIDEIGPPGRNRTLLDHELRWWFKGFALYLDRVEVLPTPVVCPGEQKIFRLPREVAEACLRQLPARIPIPDGPGSNVCGAGA